MADQKRRVKQKKVIKGKTYVLYEGDTLYQCEGQS